MTSETLIRVSYYGIFGRNQHSERLPPPFAPLFRAPPFAPPFIFIPIEWKNQNFPLFRGRTQYSWVPRWRCPPFLPPFFEFLESPKHDLQILYVSFFVKMCCFCSTDPVPKNELAILLWYGLRKCMNLIQTFEHIQKPKHLHQINKHIVSIGNYTQF